MNNKFVFFERSKDETKVLLSSSIQLLAFILIYFSCTISERHNAKDEFRLCDVKQLRDNEWIILFAVFIVFNFISK